MSTNLSDRNDLTKLDPTGILAFVEAFPRQCREAYQIATAVETPTLEALPAVVAVAGMGGSAAGGDIVKALFEAHGGAAFTVIRDYHVPNYIGVGDVVFCCSYSGNTEETLSVYEEAKKNGARIVAVTSGGKLEEKATEDGFTVYKLPGGQPPRTALGYLTIPVIVASIGMKVLADPGIESALDLLETLPEKWGSEAENNPAMELAEKLHGAVPILYGLGSWQGYVANRWRSQINENAKQLAFSNSYPELNHNEIAGWTGASAQGVGKFVGVVLEDGEESERLKTRAKVTEGLLASTIAFTHVKASGETLLEKILSLTYFGDYVSIYLARLNEVDPNQISSIDRLKSELSKLD